MIAQVMVDVGVPHLDRSFDYAIPEQLADRVKPGIRVKVRFSGRSLDGYVVGLSETSQHSKLVEISRIVSDEVVLPERSIRLIRAVADHCAGTFMDVARLAVPPRVARAEKAAWTVEPGPVDTNLIQNCLDGYPDGTGLRQALRDGRTPRAAWTLAPSAGEAGDWAVGLAGLAADTVSSGRSALILVPDATDCLRALAAVRAVVEPRRVVSLSAGLGPQARYSSFLSAVRGQARVVVGTRGAVYAPLSNLGLIACWDESDSSFLEQRSPYPSVRDIIAIRASQEHVGVVFAGYSRSVEIQSWVDKGWLVEVGLPTTTLRLLSAGVRIASQDERALERDPAARSSRLPHDIFTAIRAGLAQGPVLVWVPWAGHRRNFICRSCAEPMKCSCGGGFIDTGQGPTCQVCGSTAAGWACACGSRGWRAVTIGSARTAQELAQAFPGVSVLRSDASSPIDQVGPEPALVIATPGCEPRTVGGYPVAVILDAAGFVSRPDIHAGEQAVRRWLAVVALVDYHSGVVVIGGPPGDRAVQAVVRLDPVGFARRELADRQEAGFPPTCRMAVFTGSPALVAETAEALGQAGYVELLGPIEGAGEAGGDRLVARVPAAHGKEFARLLADLAARRSAANRSDRLSWRLDPEWLGG